MHACAFFNIVLNCFYNDDLASNITDATVRTGGVKLFFVIFFLAYDHLNLHHRYVSIARVLKHLQTIFHLKFPILKRKMRHFHIYIIWNKTYPDVGLDKIAERNIELDKMFGFQQLLDEPLTHNIRETLEK